MYRATTNLNELREYLALADIISFDLETAPYDPYRDDERAALDPRKSQIVGVSFSVSEGDAIYVPIAHRVGINADHVAVLNLLAEFAAETGITKVAHNLAFESIFLYKHGIVLQPPCYDTIAAAQMTLKGNSTFRSLSDSGLKTLVPELLGVELPSFTDVTNGRHFDELNPSDPETIRYACADADYTLQLCHLLNGWYDRYLPKHRYIIEQLESPTAVYCGLMKFNGILVDQALMTAKAAECEAQISKLRDEIAFMIGDVNIGANASASAFKQYLYKDLALPVLKTTAKYQAAADEEAFVLLKEWCHINKPELEPLFGLILQYRAIGKVFSTYIEGYRKHINSVTGRIHPQLLQLGAESGRFACRQPNVQNLVSGSEINIRDFIVAPEGSCLIELDYSQIEARIAAYLSREEQLLRIFREGGDLHAMTTASVFRIPLEEASDKRNPEYKHRRTVAKTTFFGFLYGIYAKSLQRNLKLSAGIDVTLDQGNAFLDNLANSYPTLAAWQRDVINRAKARGYAETALGRRRYLPLICSTDFIKRGNAERAALNHGVQGLAADLHKLAMGRLVCSLPPYLKPLFTVHDSFIFECPDQMMHEAAALVKGAMEIPVPIDGFDVPIVADVSIGRSYGSLEEEG